MFIALLAWSDQIRGLTREVRSLEQDFLTRNAISREEFKKVLKGPRPRDRIHALTKLSTSAKFKSAADVDAIGQFARWLKVSRRVRMLSLCKYWCTVALTISLFLSGGAAALVGPGGGVLLILLVAGSVALLTAAIALLVWVRVDEDRLADLLTAIEEIVS